MASTDMIRRKLIEDLLGQVQGVNVIVDDELLSVSVMDPAGNAYELLIDLPPEFPLLAPNIHCEPSPPPSSSSTMASLINTSGQVVGHEFLRKPEGWETGSYTLVQLITDICREFQRSEEAIAQGYTEKHGDMDCVPFPSISQSHSVSNALGHAMPVPQLPSAIFALCASDLSTIDSLTEQQAQEILANKEKFKKFTGYLKTLPESCKQLRALEAANYRQAQENVSLMQERRQLENKLSESLMKYEETLQRYRNFMSLNGEVLKSFDPEVVSEGIQLNLMELNDSSTQFIKSASISTDNYASILKEYIKMRKDYHRQSILLRKYESAPHQAINK